MREQRAREVEFCGRKGMIALEFHQLDRRYEKLRTLSREREARLLASLDRHGQQGPAVFVASKVDGQYALVDGHKLVRVLR